MPRVCRLNFGRPIYVGLPHQRELLRMTDAIIGTLLQQLFLLMSRKVSYYLEPKKRQHSQQIYQ